MKVLVLLVLGYLIRITGFASPAYAQQVPDTTYPLPGVNIISVTRPKPAIGLKCQKLDSNVLLSGTLGEKLSQHTTAYIRSAGPGNLASLSLRGTSSQQTAILWNGVDIRATGAGMIDFSLLPAILFDAAEVISGGNSALNGSGAMGGSLLLKSESVFTPHRELRAGLIAGSFHNSSVFLQLKQGSPKFGISLTGFSTHNQNEFSYQQQSEKHYNTHAALRQSGMLAEIGWKPLSRHQFRFSAWLQDSWREIPPSLTSINMNAERRDRSYRFIPEWKYSAASGVFRIKAAVFHDDLHYLEKPDVVISSIDSRILNDLHSLELAYNRSILKNLTMEAGIRHAYYGVDINQYGGRNFCQESNLWASFILSGLKDHLKSSLNMRLLAAPSGKVIPVAAAGFDLTLYRNLLWNVSLSNNYRLPALNDLYWIPGGNPDLKPEQSRNAETGLKWYLTATEQKSIEIHTHLFYSDFHDYITWIPGTPYFYAANIRKVRTQGTETGFSLRIPVYTLQVRSGLDYSRIQSRYRNAISSLDESRGKQLIYVPEHRLNFHCTVNYKRFNLTFYHNYTGKVYVTSDNAAYLPSWNLSTLTLSGRFPLNRMFSLHTEIELRNIQDTKYQVVQYYPMPGRSFLINILLIIK